jgi:hypothetical protein
MNEITGSKPAWLVSVGSSARTDGRGSGPLKLVARLEPRFPVVGRRRAIDFGREVLCFLIGILWA